MKNMMEEINLSTRDKFLEAMSCLTSSVSVITTDGPMGAAGITVSSLVSVSADSVFPTVLICIKKTSASCPIILENGMFCANVLAYDQLPIADIFAGRTNASADHRFNNRDWASGALGAPCLAEGVVTIECEITDNKTVGEHLVIFAHVKNIIIGAPAPPLIYTNRDYTTTAPTMPL